MNRGATAAITGIAFSGASFWALRLFSTLHWRVVFGSHSAHVAVPELTSAMDELGNLSRVLAVVALAFGVLAVSDGRPRWLVWLSFLVTLASPASIFFVQ